MTGASVFPCDPVNGHPAGTADVSARTTVGQLHDLFSSPVFLCLPAAGVAYARAASRAGDRTWVISSLAAAVTQLGAFLAAGAGFSQEQPALVPWGGAFQRASVIAGFGWLARPALGRSGSSARHDGSDPPITRRSPASPLRSRLTRSTATAFGAVVPRPEQCGVASHPASHPSLIDEEVVRPGLQPNRYIAGLEGDVRASRMLQVKVVSRVLFTLYLLTLLWLVLFKISYDIPSILADYRTRSINLIPFVTWGQTGASETVSNVLTFIPFGLLLGLNFRLAALWRLLLIVFASSVVLETLQFVLAIGTTDITDVVTNTIGGLVGMVVYRLASKIIDAKILDAVITVIGFILFVAFLLLRGLVLQVRY